jgi:hypothetical protein
MDEEPLSKMATEHPDLVAEAFRILEKKKADRAVMPEEYQTLARYVQLAEQRLLEYRESLRAKRRKAIERARPSIPQFAFNMLISELELARDIEDAIKFLPNVGELMVRLLVDEEHLRNALKAGNAGADAMEAIQEAIDSLVLARQEELAAADAAATAAAEAEAATQTVEQPVAEAAVTATTTEEDEEAPPAFVDIEPPTTSRGRVMPDEPTKIIRREAVPAPAAAAKPAAKFESGEASGVDADEDEDWGQPLNKGKKKKNKKSRELVFDEQRGEVVSRRKRKGNRGGEWDVE